MVLTSLTQVVPGVFSNTLSYLSQVIFNNKLPCIMLEEVSEHDSMSDCWIVIYDRVFDITKFIMIHPGGEAVLLESAGRDATFTFQSAGHNEAILATLEPYLIGVLPIEERIFKI